MRQSSMLQFLVVALLALLILLTAGAHRSLASDRNDALESRIQRVENGLLPPTTTTSLPAPPWNLLQRMEFHKVPGVSVAVIHNYQIEWARAYGTLEIGGSVPVNQETLFQAASLSKPVAAMGILALAQEGRLVLDGDANQFLRSWRIPDNQFTAVRKASPGHLLTHTAGMPGFGYYGYFVDQPLPTLLQILDGQRPPANSPALRVERVPGTAHVYSNGGFVVLQQMANDITGVPFEDWMKSAVLDKLGMTRSFFTQPLPAGLGSNAATGHWADGSKIRGNWMVHPELAAAGLWTTASDMARFVIEIQKSYSRQSNRVLSAEMVRLMLTPFVPVYGLGVELASEGAIFYHSGANNGYRNLMVGYPHTGDGAVILTNGDGGAELRQEIARAIATEYGWAHFRVDGFPVGLPSMATGTPVLNAASNRASIAPGSIVSIYGPDLAGVDEVVFQGQKATVLAQTPNQINAIVPASVAAGLALVQVRRAGLTSRAREVRISSQAPGIFTMNQRGDGAGIIVHADSFRIISEAEPARRGEFVSILCTGLGVDGTVPQVRVGSREARILYSGAMPGYPGVNQINVQIPEDAPAGAAVPVVIAFEGVTSNTVTLAIE